MSEANVINKTEVLCTRDSLRDDLLELGVKHGMTLLVHSSLGSLGWVCGGAVAVIQALMDVLTPSGTLVMPAHSGDYSDPGLWNNPGVPKEWWPMIRETMPAFEPQISPTRGIGKIPEVFRSFPNVKRSYHPSLSFSAWGKHAEVITNDHSLSYSLGEGSPLARIYDLDGWVLLLGVGHDSNTSFHLAEYRAPGAKSFQGGAPVLEDGKRFWKTYDDIEFNADVFEDLGMAFEEERGVDVGSIGYAVSRLFNQRTAVDFAVNWLTAQRVK